MLDILDHIGTVAEMTLRVLNAHQCHVIRAHPDEFEIIASAGHGPGRDAPRMPRAGPVGAILAKTLGSGSCRQKINGRRARNGTDTSWIGEAFCGVRIDRTAGEAYGLICVTADNLSSLPSDTVSVLQRQAGLVAGLVHAECDTTKLRRENEHIRHDLHKLEDIFEFLPDTAFVLDNDRRITHWNKAAEKMTGVKKEKLLGSPQYSLPFYKEKRPILVDVLDSPDSPFEARYDYVRRKGSVIMAETFIPHFNRNRGAYIWIAASRLYDRHGSRVGSIEVVRDISERRRLLESLRASEQRFQQLAENINETFFLIDKASRKILYVSPASQRILGLSPDAAVSLGQDLTRIIHRADRDRVAFADPDRRYDAPLNEEFRIVKPDGSLVWIRIRTFLVRDAEGNVVRLAGVASDITFYKEAEERTRLQQQQLIQADKMASLGVLVSGVAHEINNPNNYITLSMPLLRQAFESTLPVLENRFGTGDDLPLGAGSFDEFRDNMEYLLRSIEDGAGRIKRIVSDLKEYARTDTSEGGMEVDLNEVVGAATKLIDSYIRKRTRHFSVDLSQRRPLVRGKFQRLEQVVINLAQNACDSLADSEKAVDLTTSVTPDGAAVLRVRDEGEGIPEDIVGRIMDPFFTTKRDTGGTGLGLSVTAGIVREHGGAIDVASKPGRGTTITVTIPGNGHHE